MTTTVDPKEQQRIREPQRAPRHPGWTPDRHRLSGVWMPVILTTVITLILLVVTWFVVANWNPGGDGPTTELATLGDAYELESLGPFMSGVAAEGDARELERLGAWSQLAVAAQGDAYELERLGALSSEPTQGDAYELERLGPWTFNVDDVAAARGDALELERLGAFVPQVDDAISPQGDAYELERLGTWTP